MIKSDKVELYLKKCNAGFKYNETKVYISFFIVANILSILIVFPPFQRFTLDNIAMDSFAYSISFLGVFLFIIYLYEIKKGASFHIIYELINNLFKGSMALDNDSKSIRLIRDLHPLLASHPVSMLLYGNIFVKNGFYEIGNYLIKKANESDINFENINIFPNLNDEDAKYLINSLSLAKQVKLTMLILNMWAIKSLRKAIILILLTILLLNTASQLLK